MYADDTTLLIKNNTAEGACAAATVSLNKALNYCRINDLAINPQKTIQINFSKKKDHIPNIMNITAENHVKLLGVIIDNNLTWTEQVNSVCKKLASGIYVVRRIKWISNLESAKIAYFSLVESHMRYGLAVWGGSSARNLNRVLTLQKKAIRILAELEPRESCRQAFQTLQIMTVTALYIQEVILHAHQKNLQTGKDMHHYNTRHAANYILPLHRTALYEEKPSYIGRKLWNHLPQPLKELQGNAFKKELHDFLVKQPLYTIDEFLNQDWRSCELNNFF